MLSGAEKPIWLYRFRALLYELSEVLVVFETVPRRLWVLRSSEVYHPLSFEPRPKFFGKSGRYVGRQAQMIARPFSIVAQMRSPVTETGFQLA